jgi:hypothetical protein
MSAPAFMTGSADDTEEQYVEIKQGNVWYPYPLAPDSLMLKQPESPFSPAIQRGPSQKVLDQRMNVEVWNDFSGGMGELREDVNTSLTNYVTGTLDPREPGYLTLPPKLNSLGNLGRTFASPTYITTVRDGSGNRHSLIWGPNNGGLTRRSSAGTLTQIGNAGNVWTVYEIVAFAGALYMSQNNATDGLTLKKSTDFGVTWTNIAGTLGYKLLAIHDNKLWTIDTSTAKLFGSVDGTTWGVSAGAGGYYPMETGDSRLQLYEWSTPSGQGTTLFYITSLHHLIYEEEAGVWHEFYTYADVVEAQFTRAHVWRRNQYVYVSFYNSTDPNGMVLVHNGGTTDSVGPREKGGLPEDWFHYLTHIQGSIHDLFGFGAGGTVNSVFSYGNVMAMNDTGGWNNIMAGEKMSNGTSFVVGGGYSNQLCYAVMSNGDMYSSPVPDRRRVHPSLDGTLYDNNVHKLVKSWTSNGLDNVWKIGAYFLIDTELNDGTPGIPTGSNIQLYYRTDGNPSWVQLPLLGPTDSAPVGLLTDLSLKPSTLVWPVILPLPDGISQFGVPYKRLQWYVTEQKTPGGTTPVITQVALYYTLWLEQFYSHSFNIDLTEDRFRRYPGGLLDGYDREFLQAKLEEISQNKGYNQFRFSIFPWQKPVVASDMLLTHRVNTNDGGAIIGVSLRDLTAPKA